MCILDENDLFDLMKDKNFIGQFNLTERQKKIVMLHIQKGFTFEIISGIEKRSVTAVHDVYTDALKKMRKQVLKMLKQQLKKPKPSAPLELTAYIGGEGVASYDNTPLGWRKVG